MQQPWRFVDTGARDAASNMALDEALLVMHEAGATLPTLRVYGWCQPTLSLGYTQNAQQEVDLIACHTQGVAVVRRPTGGRAVLHDQEVTYSVVMPLTLVDGPHTITEHYRRIVMALATALQALGLPVQLARPQVRATPTHAPASPACFAALSRYELSVAGKKNGRQCPEACPACPAATWLYTSVDGPATAVPVFASATRAPYRSCADRLQHHGRRE
jgi:lipoate-protein ligase A